jgi:glycosyltransferase involved in cell wall biosynthesis
MSDNGAFGNQGKPSLNTPSCGVRPKLLFVVTEDWYFVSHRLPIALAALNAGFDVALAARVTQHGSLIEKSGLTVFPVAFQRGRLGPFADLETILRLVQIYRSYRPDIVHHVALKPVLYGTIAARITRVKRIVNALGGLGFVFSSDTIRARLLRKGVIPALRMALRNDHNRTIVQNIDDRSKLLSLGISTPTSIRLIRGSGVDLTAYRRCDTLKQPPLVVLPARLLREKGVYEFVAAARQLHLLGVKARFALVGQADPMNPSSIPAHQLEAWKNEGHVEFWGWRQDMDAIFEQAQIVCLPSYHEGLPRALLEASACGCAIVASDIPGCRELIKHGETGLLVPPRDITALAAALKSLIEHPAERKIFGQATRATLDPDFTIETVVNRTLDIYRELMPNCG